MGKNVAIGLDIGSSSIKIAQLQRGRDGIQLQQFGVNALPFGSIDGGTIPNPELISSHVKEAMSRLKIKTKEVVAAVAGQSVIVRHVKFPIMEEEELKNVIQYESERYIPYPPEEACIDFAIVGRDEANGEMEVMLVAAQRQLIESHVQCLIKAGLQPIAIDVQPFALIRALGLMQGSINNNSSVVVIDIGAGTTDLLIYKSGSPRFTRIIPIAGNRLTEAVSASFGCSFEEAEKLKILHADPLIQVENNDAGKVNKSIQAVLDELVLEVRRSIDYYRLQQRSEDVGQVIIAGGGARLRNCEEYFSRELGIRVSKGNPFNLLNLNSNSNQDVYESAPVLSVAIGLALREVE